MKFILAVLMTLASASLAEASQTPLVFHAAPTFKASAPVVKPATAVSTSHVMPAVLIAAAVQHRGIVEGANESYKLKIDPVATDIPGVGIHNGAIYAVAEANAKQPVTGVIHAVGGSNLKTGIVNTPAVYQGRQMLALNTGDTGPVGNTMPASTPSSEPTLDSLLKDAEKVQQDWTALGMLAGLIALVNLLVNLTKFGLIKKWFDDNNLQWLRSVLALVLGGALGGLGAASLGGNAGKIVFGALAGVVGGLSAVGNHQVFIGLASVVNPKKS